MVRRKKPDNVVKFPPKIYLCEDHLLDSAYTDIFLYPLPPDPSEDFLHKLRVILLDYIEHVSNDTGICIGDFEQMQTELDKALDYLMEVCELLHNMEADIPEEPPPIWRSYSKKLRTASPVNVNLKLDDIQKPDGTVCNAGGKILDKPFPTEITVEFLKAAHTACIESLNFYSLELPLSPRNLGETERHLARCFDKLWEICQLVHKKRKEFCSPSEKRPKPPCPEIS